jgi:putative MATE family efflux protein
VIVAAGNAVNVVLELLFVYGFDWGIEGSAWGTVVAQAGMGAAFGVTLWRAARRDPWPHAELLRRLLTIGRHIFVRTAALMASFLVASAVLARIGDAALAAHQVAFQLWLFLALVLDAIAIAGQVIVGRMLGSSDPDRAFAASARMIWLAVAVGAVFAALLLAVEPFLPLVFTTDDAVLDQVHEIWWLFALMQPLNGAVFALDGILIGAGDGRYLMWSMVASFAVSASLALAALELGWGIVGVWGALVALIVVRLATLGVRFRTRRWLVTGWA